MPCTYAKDDGQYEIWDDQQLVGTATDLRHARLFCAAKEFRRIVYDLREELCRCGPHNIAIVKKCIDIIDAGMGRARSTPQKRRHE